jgi:hypothetical protein
MDGWIVNMQKEKELEREREREREQGRKDYLVS